MRDVKGKLNLLNRIRLIYVVGYWWVMLAGQAIEEMRPSRVVVRISLFQIAMFLYLGYRHDMNIQFLYSFVIGNLLLVGFVMSPIWYIVRRSPHWVGK